MVRELLVGVIANCTPRQRAIVPLAKGLLRCSSKSYCIANRMRQVGGFAKLVRGFCRCSSVPGATCHFSRKFVAHRVSPNFTISGIILHRCPVIYFLTDL